MWNVAPVALLGRDAERRECVDWIASGARLVSIVGPVGVGKSSLARAAMAELVGTGMFAAAHVVDLTGAASASELDAKLGDALGGDRLTDDGFEGSSVLVLVDNVDESVAALRARAPSWLRAAPGLTLLLTAREALGVEDERALALRPFPVSRTFDGPAAALMTACVRRIDPAYEPAPVHLSTLTALIQELDGLPLAIELCAPRLAVMTPNALLHRLRTGSSALDGLDRALDGAWQGLEPEDRLVLGAVSEFPHSFDYDAAQAALGESRGAASRLLGLRQRSWLTAETLTDGSVRLAVLGCIRRFAQARTSQGKRAVARRNIVEHFAELVRCGDIDTAVERANLDFVLESVVGDRPVTRAEAEPALTVLVGLYFDSGRIPSLAHLTLLQPLLRNTQESGADPRLLCRALIAAGAARQAAGDSARALHDLAQSERLAESLNDEALRVRALTEVAEVLLDQGEPAASRKRAEVALGSGRDGGVVEARLLRMVGEAQRELGEDARLVLDRSCALMPAANACRARYQLALMHLDGSDAAAARRVFADAASSREELYAELVSLLAELSGTPGGSTVRLDDLAVRALAAQVGEVERSARFAAMVVCIEAGRLGAAYARCVELRRESGVAWRLRQLLETCLAFLDSRVLRPSAAVDGSGPGFERSDLFWCRVVARAVSADHGPSEGAPALRVSDDGSWFQLREQPAVSLARRRPLAAILKTLAAARQSRAGAAVSRDALQAAAWPGQKLVAEAGAHRVRVAVSTLRKLGLSDVLLTEGSGYLLSTGQSVMIESGDPT